MGRWISQAILTASLKIKLPLISFLAYISHLNMVKPTTKKELQKIIIETIDREGNECDLNFIDTSLITDMSNLFCVMHDFNGKINNVTDMRDMFAYTETFNQPLNKWNVVKSEIMCGMFKMAKAFNQPLDKWDVSNVDDMTNMFCQAELFNQPLDKWQVTDRTVTSDMFAGSNLKSLPEWFR